MNLLKPSLIALFGAIGVLVRFELAEGFRRMHYPFYLSTLICNATGGILIGIAYVFFIEKGVAPEPIRAAIIVGLLGGLTTFSTFALEINLFLQRNELFQAASYWLISSVLSIICCAIGIAASRWIA